MDSKPVLPSLVIVGRVNRGKSSILSTLAEDDSVCISPDPGTTTEVRCFPLRVDGEPLLQFVDTPGFEDPLRVLEFLRERESSAATRSEVVAEFVRHFEGSDCFQQECKLLRPILDGGGILYVVDGSHPFRSNYEAEMEILRWTGQPRMALINCTGARDYKGAWRMALDQYFSIVRVFNAHRAPFAERVALLRALREICDQWRSPLDRAIAAMEQDWERRYSASARILAEMLVEELRHTRTISVTGDGELKSRKARIEAAFHEDLRRCERKCRRRIEALYLHGNLQCDEEDVTRPVLDRDLFSRKTWRSLGLSGRQLMTVGFFGGAATGGGLDVLSGGSALGAGTVLGGIAGAGAAVFFGGSPYASAGDWGRFFRGGRTLVVGPHRNPNFPWVLLDRALLHYVSVRERAHGRRDPLSLYSPVEGVDESAPIGIVSRLDDRQRRTLGRILRQIQSSREGTVEKKQFDLEEQLRELLPGLHLGSGE